MASRCTDDEIKVMKLADCKKLLIDYVSELRQYDELLGEFDDGAEDIDGPLKMMRMFAAGVKQMQALQGKVETIEAQYQKITNQSNEHEKIKDTLELQQSMVENLDRKNREAHIIITGVQEDQSLDGADNDEDKWKKIFDKMGGSEDATSVKSVRRLGKPENKKRPMLVIGTNVEWRNKVIENAKNLKKAGNSYKEIMIKKDVHPAVRREWWRLHTTKESEEKRPENVGHIISIDYKRRVVLRDDVVIDKWSPNNNFVNRGPRS